MMRRGSRTIALVFGAQGTLKGVAYRWLDLQSTLTTFLTGFHMLNRRASHDVRDSSL